MAQPGLTVRLHLDVFDYYVQGEAIRLSGVEDIRYDFVPHSSLSGDGVHEMLVDLNRFGATKSETVVVFIRPATYDDRRVAVRLAPAYLPDELSADMELRIHVVPRRLKISPTVLDQFLRSINWMDPVHRDAALALLEYQLDHVDTTDGLDVDEIRIYYNFARALYNTCVEDSYDTCAAATDAFAEMLSLYETDEPTRSGFERSGINAATFRNNLLQLEHKRVQRRYEAVEALTLWEVDAQDATAAKFCLLRDILMTEFPEHEAVWRAQGRPEAGLHADTGMAGLGFVQRTLALARDGIAPADLRGLLTDVPCMSSFLNRLAIDSPFTVVGALTTWVLEETIHHYQRAIHLFEEDDMRMPGVYRVELLAMDLARARQRLGRLEE